MNKRLRMLLVSAVELSNQLAERERLLLCQQRLAGKISSSQLHQQMYNLGHQTMTEALQLIFA